MYKKYATEKTRITLHHTAGGSIDSAVSEFSHTNKGTAYIIGRNGELKEYFDPLYWANHINYRKMPPQILAKFKSPIIVEKRAIGIELVSYGALLKNEAGVAKAWNGKIIDQSEIEEIPIWRGAKYFHSYTQSQINTLKELIKSLCG